MASLVSNLVDNLSEGIHKMKCKDCDCFLEYESGWFIELYMPILQYRLFKKDWWRIKKAIQEDS